MDGLLQGCLGYGTATNKVLFGDYFGAVRVGYGVGKMLLLRLGMV